MNIGTGFVRFKKQSDGRKAAHDGMHSDSHKSGPKTAQPQLQRTWLRRAQSGAIFVIHSGQNKVCVQNVGLVNNSLLTL